MDLEDGELSTDSDSYTPLERPPSYSAMALGVPQRFSPKKQESDSDVGALTASSQSDSDDSDQPDFRAKKPKVHTKHAVPQRLGSKKKKYDVWSHRAQEDSLLAIDHCDVTQKENSRDVENYNFPKREPQCHDDQSTSTQLGDDDVRHRLSNKRNRAEMLDASQKLMHRSRRRRDNDEQKKRYEPRVLKDILWEEEKSSMQLAQEMANALLEEKEDLILKVIEVIGGKQAMRLYNRVREIEGQGGMLIANQSRRRTPGGVYLFLLKHDDDIPKHQLDEVFRDERRKNTEFIKDKKKKRLEQMKIEINMSKRNLPEQLTRADLELKLAERSWPPKNEEREDVVNPPPTPETDGHVDSGDADGDGPKLEKYESDFLDICAGDDMDMF